MVVEMETQGRLKRARLDSAKKNSQLMETNIEELGSAEQRDSTVQTKVLVFFFGNVTMHVFAAAMRCIGFVGGENGFVVFFSSV